MGYLTKDQLETQGFKKLGSNVLISDKCSIYNAKHIEIGSNVRIDDFCILSASDEGISIGNYVHIACYVSLIGNGKIEIENYVGISMKSTVLSSTDDFSGDFLTGPTIPKNLLNVYSKKVIFKEHSLVGAHSLILPGAILNEGVAIGAMSLAYKDLKSWTIYAGNPLRELKPRSKKLLESVKFLES